MEHTIPKYQGASYFSDFKQLIGKSAIYGMGSIILKIIGFIFIPLYTRFMSTDDYGIIGIASSLLSILVILFSLELRGAINYFYSISKHPAARNDYLSMIWITLLAFSLTMATIFNVIGESIFSKLFWTVPFSPHLQLVVWTACFIIVGQFPQVLLQVREKPLLYVTLLVSNAILNIGFTIYFVVLLKLGAYGYLLGVFISSLIMTIPYFIITLFMIRPKIQFKVMGAILAYSLPLIIHSVSAWILEYSDRVIIEKYDSLSNVGIYSLAYQIGSIVYLVAAAFNSAWVPFIYRIESTKLENNQPVNSRLVTYYFAIISIILLSVILFTRDISVLVLPEQYRRIDSLATLIAIGQLFQAIYFIPVNFLFLRAKTKYIPIITLLSGGIDISLNLLFVPRYGVAAAAWAGIISKVVMALTAYLISMKYYPFKYEYIRISKLAVMVLFFILVHQLIGQPSVSKSLAIHSIMLFSIPFFLLVIGFFYKDETMHIKTLIGRVTNG